VHALAALLAHNRSISSNERPDTLNPGIKNIWSPSVSIQLPSFPFGCYTNPYPDMDLEMKKMPVAA
jgi:hypothetical protein